MKPFDDPEATRPKIPDDVQAFLAEVEARANKATPGTWHATESIRNLCWFVEDKEGFTVARTSDHLPARADDAEFIANARADISRLIAIAREQAEELASLRNRLAKLETACDEIVSLRDECAVDPTTIVNRSLQKLDNEIVQMSVLLNEKDGV